MLLVLSSSALAASIINPSGGNSGKSGGDYEMERDLEGGIHLVCNGIGIDEDKNIYIDLTITTEDDMVIEVSTNDAEIFDANNRRFEPYDGYWAWVGDTRRSREVIGGIPIGAGVSYDTPKDYALTEFYPRVSFTFNGKKLIFRNVQGKN
jgi:hypothetical protein